MRHNKYMSTLTLTLCVLFSLVLASAYFHFIIERTYEVSKQVPCDPKTDSCFVSDCEANDSTCDSTRTYKKIVAPAKYAGLDYEKFICEAGNLHCKIITCSPETVEDGEKCFQ